MKSKSRLKWVRGCAKLVFTLLLGLSGLTDVYGSEPTLSTAKLSLNVGWNLVALPLQPKDGRVSAILQPLKGKYESVWTYSDGQWHGFGSTLAEQKAKPATLKAGSGVFIYMKAPAELQVTGTRPENAAHAILGQDLAEGWNLVGFSSSRKVSVSEAFKSLEGSYDAVIGIKDGSWQQLTAGSEEPVEPFSGYWVHTTQTAKWFSPGLTSRIVDATTGLPVAGATVSLGGIEADKPSAADGSFTVNGISDDRMQVLTVGAAGYKPSSLLVDTSKLGIGSPFAKIAQPVPIAPLPVPAVGEVFTPQNRSQWLTDKAGAGIPVLGYTSLNEKSPFQLDVVFVIDTSGSTSHLTDYDLERDGTNDTVLDVELYAVKRLLNRLRSKHVRCGIIKFARYHTKNAPDGGVSTGPILTEQTRVVQSLTDDDQAIQAALTTVATEGSKGGTHTAAGIDLALQTLTNAPTVSTLAGKGGHDTPVRHIVLLTDGIPTLPIEGGDTQEGGDRQETIAAAQRAFAANVQIHPVVIDSVDAERKLTTMPSVQAISGVPGGLVRVGLHDISHLPHLLDNMTFAGINKVLVRDLATGASWSIDTTPDGWFDATIPATAGIHNWEFTFSASDSKQALVRKVSFEVVAPAQAATSTPISQD